jgi:hypothetical protein
MLKLRFAMPARLANVVHRLLVEPASLRELSPLCLKRPLSRSVRAEGEQQRLTHFLINATASVGLCAHARRSDRGHPI